MRLDVEVGISGVNVTLQELAKDGETQSNSLAFSTILSAMPFSASSCVRVVNHLSGSCGMGGGHVWRVGGWRRGEVEEKEEGVMVKGLLVS